MEWLISKAPVDYLEALKIMEERVEGILSGYNNEAIWLLEHPPIFTGGTSAKKQDLFNPDGFPVYETGRGGEYTYHGPGQRVAYVMRNLGARDERDVRQYVYNLEQWIIEAVKDFNITAERRDGRIGLWVQTTDKTEKKIAAIGVRVRKWVTYHGIAINVDSDLSHFSGIVPCGIHDYGVTSIKDILGKEVPLEDLDKALKKAWNTVFKS